MDGVEHALKDALLVLFAVALAVMALTLLLVFRSRLRLLPLAIALAAAALVFGLTGLLGGSLTMASIAALPILIGLAVDYAIQFQSRFDESVANGAEGHAMLPEPRQPPAAPRSPPPASPRPPASSPSSYLPRRWSASFGLLLLVGIALTFALALTAGFAARLLGAKALGTTRTWEVA